ncbi:uncharacterized protein Z520_09680 [Fonsecaea multimorphosa CBS 102226]|uniref:Epoxide hydrolase N-terminal domain-containing protein n=1 Tax=Fonsecaea multimorphosa CBS 102226 TaxID=1442371 RepID=A0A0D2JVU7_9EURO|nr:uncharacterized protein Z520_09680 [Fonsecaea multimorphosa CBS 102226]KIX94634.1 hypothetical protein Z520_09680 [Fonsecaea multimorphosa CBS 102226]
MAPTKLFGDLPSNAAANIVSFDLHIPTSDVDHMRNLLKLTPVASPVYENSLPDGGRHLGLRRDWLVEAKRVWETEFDWHVTCVNSNSFADLGCRRKTEDRVNSFPNFTAPIDDQLGSFNIHFVAFFSRRHDAVPVVMLHGWPGSFLEFLPLLELFRQKFTPETLPYHLVVPTLPGFTLSSVPPINHDISQIDVARIMNTLMQRLGFDSYIAQGGDVGSRVARIMAAEHDACKAVNFCLINRPASATDDSTLSKIEQEGVKRQAIWRATEAAYALEHGTKPSTVGFVLSSNPVALLSWYVAPTDISFAAKHLRIGEKYLTWTDDPLPLNTILESVSLYWLSKRAHSSLWSYRHTYGPNPIPHDDPRHHIKVPMGYSYYPMELIPIPISWVATTGNLVWSKIHKKGGHFAALEQPRDFMEDLEAFIASVWSRSAQ